MRLSMRRWLIVSAALAIGCGSPSFEIGTGTLAVPGSDAENDSPESETDLEVDTGAPAPDVAKSDTSDAGDAGDSGTPDTGSGPSDTGVATVDTGTTGTLDTGTLAADTDPRAAIVFPIVSTPGDTWTTKHGPGTLAVVGDSVKGTRVLSGGQTGGAATLQTDGDGIASHQIQVALFIDGAKVGEDRAYPAQRAKYAFTLPSALASGPHAFEFRVTAVFSCVPLPDCSGGYFRVQDTTVSFY